jgi:hypothetical protein
MYTVSNVLAYTAVKHAKRIAVEKRVQLSVRQHASLKVRSKQWQKHHERRVIALANRLIRIAKLSS